MPATQPGVVQILHPSSFILFLSQEDVCELLLRHRQLLAGSHGLAEVDSQDVFALQS